MEKIKINRKKTDPLVYDDAEKERFEEYYFSASHKGKEVGHLITTKVLDPISDIEFDLDNPVASFGSVDPKYQKRGIMTSLLKEANNFCLKKYNQPLISGFEDSDSMKYLWKNLEKQKEAEKRNYSGLEYWVMNS